jgi:hypothetical protein
LTSWRSQVRVLYRPLRAFGASCEFEVMSSEVSRLQLNTHNSKLITEGFRGRSSDGRALQSHCRGQGFDSPRLHWLDIQGSWCHRSSGVEHSIRNRAVVGSIPTGGSDGAGDAGVAQLVEHQLPKLRVAGSSPVSRSGIVKNGMISRPWRNRPRKGDRVAVG